MTRTEIRDELDGIQYMMDTICNKLSSLINESCINPSFRTRIHKAENKISDSSDHIHFAKHIINDLIYEESTREY